ncbi:hypothetical protein JOF35_006521 [Streptomyces demainii]|uniref:Transposase n=1 Tax=Streptomyces demainii TaxID=588122 RepID=A0ABT9L0H5_9ACTN|nr:hypothetical protein [Streptomyces demainii]
MVVSGESTFIHYPDCSVSNAKILWCRSLGHFSFDVLTSKIRKPRRR